ncbi:MAG TPA: S4 domain-containing protein [Candidatus Acidoferrum sp.]|nr:S4 domain-containing protein [Candidatus Acidoferrum sp.]
MQERLQKIIARAGIASRRHAEQLILSGQVRVNGKVVRELGTKADAATDKIEAAGREVRSAERLVYLVLHKPAEIVSAMADPEGRKTLKNCLRGFRERVYPVGNLEYAASGLVFLTNDGDFAAEMLKRWDEVPQTYHVKVKGRLTLEELEVMGKRAGVKLRVVRQPGAARGQRGANFWYEVALRGAKRDALRDALFAAGHPVEKLVRVGVASLGLEGVPVGRYRMLNEKEAAGLRASLKRGNEKKKFGTSRER